MSQPLKVSLVGASRCGKTCLSNRAVSDTYYPLYKETLGFVAQSTQLTDVTGITPNVSTVFFDCGGAELSEASSDKVFLPHSITSAPVSVKEVVATRWARICDGAVAVVICYDITSALSFQTAKEYYFPQAQKYAKNAFFMLIGCKADLETHRKVPVSDAESFAAKANIFFMETSALDGTNIDLTLTILRIRMSHAVMKGSAPRPSQQALDVSPVTTSSPVPMPILSASSTPLQTVSNTQLDTKTQNGHGKIGSSNDSATASVVPLILTSNETASSTAQAPTSATTTTEFLTTSSQVVIKPATSVSQMPGMFPLDALQTISALVSRTVAAVEKTSPPREHHNTATTTGSPTHYSAPDVVAHNTDGLMPYEDTQTVTMPNGQRRRSWTASPGTSLSGSNGPVAPWRHVVEHQAAHELDVHPTQPASNAVSIATSMVPNTTVVAVPQKIAVASISLQDLMSPDKPDHGHAAMAASDSIPHRMMFASLSGPTYAWQPAMQPNWMGSGQLAQGSTLTANGTVSYSTSDSASAQLCLSDDIDIPTQGAVDLTDSLPDHRRHNRETAPELHTKPRPASEKDPRRVLLYIDVKIAGNYVGQLEVRRHDNPFSVSHKFVMKHRLDASNIIKLAKIVESRLAEYLRAEAEAEEKERRKKLKEEVQEYRYKRTVPQPFSLHDDAAEFHTPEEPTANGRHVARGRGEAASRRSSLAGGEERKASVSRGGSRSRRARLLGKLHVQLAPGRVGLIAIREGDRAESLVNNFIKSYSIRNDGAADRLLHQVSTHILNATQHYSPHGAMSVGGESGKGSTSSFRRESVASDAISTTSFEGYEAVIALGQHAHAEKSSSQVVRSTPQRGPTRPVIPNSAAYLQPTASSASHQRRQSVQPVVPNPRTRSDWDAHRSVSPDARRGIQSARIKRMVMDYQAQCEKEYVQRRCFPISTSSPKRSLSPRSFAASRFPTLSYEGGIDVDSAAPVPAPSLSPLSSSKESIVSNAPVADHPPAASAIDLTLIDHGILAQHSAVPLETLTDQQRRLLAATLAPAAARREKPRAGTLESTTAAPNTETTTEVTQPVTSEPVSAVSVPSWPTFAPPARTSSSVPPPSAAPALPRKAERVHPHRGTKPLFNLEVDIGEGKTGRITVFEGADAGELASVFVAEHGLPEGVIPRLVHLISSSKAANDQRKVSAKKRTDMSTREFR